MSWPNPRRNLFLCVGLDLLGLGLVLIVQMLVLGRSLVGQLGWMAITMVVYVVLGWLFGSYTVLSWQRMPGGTLLQRLGLVLLASLAGVALLRWGWSPASSVWVVGRSSQVAWLVPTMVWSLVVRVVLRWGALLPDEPQLLLVAPDQEAALALHAWQVTPRHLMPRRISQEEALSHPGPFVLAVSPSLQQDMTARRWLEQLEERDPRECSLTTPLTLAEQQLERLPPVLVPEPWLSYNEIPWNAAFGLQRQLKRVADVLVALVLLILSAPIVLVAALCIWLEDRGPVFYSQQRSGWLGAPFKVFKLRTMSLAPCSSPVRWTVPGDTRITRVGWWLRRLRLDELPQFVNVLRGEMSLIGPRPERPELETRLELAIKHYRKRHWMRPGLSGWAQVCAPYAASIEDSDLKLSYDLYYLKNFSTWLDFVILMRTVKTLLKAAGR